MFHLSSKDIRITARKLKSLAPTSKKSVRDSLVAPLNYYLPDYNITTKIRVSAFLAQCAHETAHFQTLEEYGGPDYWSRYNGREDLGNRKGTDDGITYHGRGIFQLTGRANYAAMSERLHADFLEHPEKVAEPNISVQIACIYWTDRRLNDLADVQGKASRAAFVGITWAINGGINGLSNRLDYWERASGIDWFR